MRDRCHSTAGTHSEAIRSTSTLEAEHRSTIAPNVVAMVMKKTLLAGVVLQLQNCASYICNEEFEDDDGVGSYM